MRTTLAILSLACCVLLAHPAHATTIAATSIAAIAERSDAVVTGTVEHINYARRDGHIVTEITLLVEATYGDSVDSRIEIYTLGGRLGHYATVVPGTAQFALGERVLVFLTRADDGYICTSMAYSKFRLETSGGETIAVRDIDGMTLAPPAGVVVPDMERAAFPLDTLDAIIRDAVEAP